MEKVNLSLKADDINLIFQALAEGQYKTVAPLMANIQQQVEAQLAESTKEPKDEKQPDQV